MKNKVKEIISFISQELLSQDSMPVIEKKVVIELQQHGYAYDEISEALNFIIKFIEKNKTEKKYFEGIRVFSSEENLKLTLNAKSWLKKIYTYRIIPLDEFEKVLAMVSSSVRVYDLVDVKNLVRSVLDDKIEIPNEFVLQ